MLHSKYGIDTIIVDTPIIAKMMGPYLPSTVRVISKQSTLKYYLLLLSGVVTGLFKYIASSLLRYVSFRLALLVSKKPPYAVSSEPVTVIETYLYGNSFNDGHFSDRHFNNIKAYLSEPQISRLLYIPTLYQVYNSFSLYLKAFKSGTKFLFIEEYISLADIFAPLQHAFLLDYTQSNIKIRDVDISRLVNHSLTRHSTHTSSLYAILKYRFCCNLKNSSPVSINRVVRWYENQEIDHGSIMGWRAYSDSLLVVGYMGFFASSNYLCAYPMPIEYNSRMTPDYIGVMGKGLIERHKVFCEPLNVEVVPSFRFATPVVNIQAKSSNVSDIKVLVALPISQVHAHTVLKAIEGVSYINHECSILFMVKPHPASSFSLGGRLVNQGNVKYKVVNDSLATLFEEVDFVLSTASSTIVEAIMHGIFVLLVSSTQSLRENVIPEFVPDSLWHEVYSADEVYAAITRYEKHSKLNADELALLNSKIIGLPPTSQNVVSLLGGFDS